MAGVTDFAFRSIAVSAGADFCYTEMVSAKALMYNSKKTFDLLHTAENESIKAVQIFGSDPEVLAAACASEALKKFDIIDINMGCPAPKIVNNGEGSFLLKDIVLAEKIVSACVAATNTPITVKIRSGWDIDSVNAVCFAKMCERAGAKAITVHGRVRNQFFSGKVDYDIIKQVVDAVAIPVIANGDVFDKESYEKIKQTGCAGVMVGRGALGNPQIFAELLGHDKPFLNQDMIEFHINELLKVYPEQYVVKYMRKHILWYLKSDKNAKNIKSEIVKTISISDIKTLLKDYFNSVVSV